MSSPLPLSDIYTHRLNLESQFPTLAFHIYQNNDAYPNTWGIRIFKRDDFGKYMKEVVTQRWHDEVVDPATFPDEAFIVKCVLIS